MKAQTPWDEYRKTLINSGSTIDIASDNDDGIGSPEPNIAIQAIQLVVANFQTGLRVTDVQCYTNLSTGQFDNNRFDYLFSGWVDYWKWRGKIAGKSVPASLSPNLIKAQAYKESSLGQKLTNVGGRSSFQEIPNVLQITSGSRLILAGFACIDYAKPCTGNNLKLDKKKSSIQWGFINAVNHNTDPAHSVGAGVRLLIYEYTAAANATVPAEVTKGYTDPVTVRWLKALYFYGPGGNYPGATSYGLRIWKLYQTGVFDNTRLFYPPDPNDRGK